MSDPVHINRNGVLKRASADLWDTAQNASDTVPNLWNDIAYHMGHRIIPDVITAAVAFSAGETGYRPKDGEFYQAKNNGTVRTPSEYPAAWKEVTI